MKSALLIKLILIFQILFLTACEDIPTVSILDETDNFEQASSFDNKIDILWVVDNSNSMANLQTNVANNFQSFIGDFVAKDFDFQMAVTTTESWRELYGNIYCDQQSGISSYRNDSGFTILDKNTPDLANAFLDNIIQGVSGCGDERALSSMLISLTDSNNLAQGFPREGAFLAVIIVSDEDDFSHDGGDYLWNDYNDARLTPVDEIVSAMDVFTGSTEDRRLYNISPIAIFDDACLEANDPWGLIASRMGEIADKTNGVKASVCSEDFSASLQEIGEKIVVLSTQFYLSREPILESIEVIVNGVNIPNSSENGWVYKEESNSILFSGTAIPNQGAQIEINFDPVALKN